MRETTTVAAVATDHGAALSLSPTPNRIRRYESAVDLVVAAAVIGVDRGRPPAARRWTPTQAESLESAVRRHRLTDDPSVAGLTSSLLGADLHPACPAATRDGATEALLAWGFDLPDEQEQVADTPAPVAPTDTAEVPIEAIGLLDLADALDAVGEAGMAARCRRTDEWVASAVRVTTRERRSTSERVARCEAAAQARLRRVARHGR